ncbi:Heparinase II/III-like protein [Histomonas meleagridis]|uniref:Heparinase II/III-like protein n=1 Tax=Histomonas meleagridis TaxID=135588 RepID=UPI0035595F53|nr:Heparinase II/III-like protein [Histomonas meleagridis]KAH0805845.1 Heparinase II/III-like protein [Histomonas meleagridis]
MSDKTIWIQFDVLDKMYFLEFTGEETFGDAVQQIKKDFRGRDLIFVAGGENITQQELVALNKIPTLSNADGIAKVRVSVSAGTGSGLMSYRSISSGSYNSSTYTAPTYTAPAPTQTQKTTIPAAKPIPSNPAAVQTPAKPAPAPPVSNKKTSSSKSDNKKQSGFKFATKKQRKDPADFEKKIKEVMDVWPNANQAAVEEALRDTNYNTNNAVLQLMSAQTFCPHCVKTGKNWNAKGSWRWNPKHPNQLKCGVCGHVFPSTEYPEDYVVTSKYDPRQSFAYITKVGPVKCLKYVSCSSAPSMIIRGYKISYIISRLTDLAYTYVITDEDKYASTVRKVLLQLAECLPKYLVAEGYPYNEFADCDPHYAALNLEKLPDSKCRKIAGPGVDPNATMFSGYWGAHRMSSNGDEGEKVKIIATSFDLTMASNVYSDADIETIKEKVLIESTYLAIGDKSINNKSVMNLAGAAIVGLITKSIKLIHFGIKGFLTSISDWFLKDGSTSQSAMYGHKVLSGLFDFGYAFTNYSDPLDYKEPDRYDQLNVATDTKYDQCWQNLIWTSYSTFLYPPIADNSLTFSLPDEHAEYVMYGFPGRFDSYVASKMRGKTFSALNMFFFDNSNYNSSMEYNFPDIVFPYWAQAYIRTGLYGEKSLLVLDASDYGGHHQMDSLNIVYWKDGYELLSDLGYLVDHVNGSKLYDTYVHNTVLIDSNNQIQEGRGGNISLYVTIPNVKVIQASSKAYTQCDIYNRTVIQIENNNSSYLVDIFRVKGGNIQQYVFHGVDYNYTLKGDLNFSIPFIQKPNRFVFRFLMNNVGTIEVSDPNISLIKSDGTFDKNQAKPFPDVAPKVKDKDEIPSDVLWGIDRKVNYSWESIEGKYTRGVKFTIKQGKGGLYIGNTRGKTAKNGFKGYENNKVYISFWMRGTIMPTIKVAYWKSGRENETSSKTFGNFQLSSSAIKKDEWTFFEGIASLGADMSDQKYGITNNEWNIKWLKEDQFTFTAYFPAIKEQKVVYQDGWGQRHVNNSDAGKTLPYFMVTDNGTSNNINTFVAVYEGCKKDECIVKNVKNVKINEGNVALEINTINGNDYVLSSFNNNRINEFGYETDASVAIISNNYTMIGGTYLNDTKKRLHVQAQKKNWFGKINKFENPNYNDSYFEIITDMPIENFNGQSLSVIDEGFERAYRIFGVEKISNGYNVYTRKNGYGFRLNKTGEWRIASVSQMDIKYTPEVTSSPSSRISESVTFEPDLKLNAHGSFLTCRAIAGIAAVCIVVLVGVAAEVATFILKSKAKNNQLSKSFY